MIILVLLSIIENTISPILFSNMGNKVFYCGAVVAAMLDLAAMDKANLALSRKEVFGEELTTFRGIPIRQCDAIIEDEAQVS